MKVYRAYAPRWTTRAAMITVELTGDEVLHIGEEITLQKADGTQTVKRVRSILRNVPKYQRSKIGRYQSEAFLTGGESGDVCVEDIVPDEILTQETASDPA